MKNLDDIAKEHGIDNIDVTRSLHREKAVSLKQMDMKIYCRTNLRTRSGKSLTRSPTFTKRGEKHG